MLHLWLQTKDHRIDQFTVKGALCKNWTSVKFIPDS